MSPPSTMVCICWKKDYLFRFASNRDRDKIGGLGRAGASALQVHRALMEHPVATSGSLVEKPGITPATVTTTLAIVLIVAPLTSQIRSMRGEVPLGQVSWLPNEFFSIVFTRSMGKCCNKSASFYRFFGSVGLGRNFIHRCKPDLVLPYSVHKILCSRFQLSVPASRFVLRSLLFF